MIYYDISDCKEAVSLCGDCFFSLFERQGGKGMKNPENSVYRKLQVNNRVQLFKKVLERE